MASRLLAKLQRHAIKIALGLLIFLFFLVFFFDSIFITVYPGHAGVLFKRFFNRGTVQQAYGEGVNIIFPWDKMYIYETRVRKLIQEVNVLTMNGLTVGIKVSVRYHPDRGHLPLLHQLVGPDYDEKIIVPATISSVREVIGKYTPEELYTSKRHVIQDEVLIEAIQETGRLPIIYDAIIVESILLPPQINDAIEAKLRQEQIFLEYAFRLKREQAEVDRKRIEAEGIRTYQQIIAQSLTKDLLKWQGIQASLDLAKSPNAKVVVFGSGEGGLPLILNTAENPAAAALPATSPPWAAGAVPAR